MVQLVEKKYWIAKVVDVDKENEITYCEDIYTGEIIACKGVRHHVAERMGCNTGDIGYYVTINHYEDGYFIIEQVHKDNLREMSRNAYKHIYQKTKKAWKDTNGVIEICFGKESGISTFNRQNKGKKGWCKRITGLDSEMKNGYGIKGDWVSLTKTTKTEIVQNQLYIDCSPSENGCNYHLFTVKDGEIILLAETDVQQGWANELWKDIEENFELLSGHLMPI